MRLDRPLCCIPSLHARPWGGRGLALHLAKALPPGDFGESWELCGLAGHESQVDVEGRPVSIHSLLEATPRALLGDAPPADGRFPLLLKFIAAEQDLSVQVHPRAGGAAAAKHEAWYVVHAEPGARLLLGAREGATLRDFAAAAGRPDIVPLLRARPVSAGDVFYVPSGTPHAIGAGIVVAEIQTPSDVTYRLYDWGRGGAAGARTLHLEEGLANLRVDVPEAQIVQSPKRLEDGPPLRTRLCANDAFAIDELVLAPGAVGCVPVAPHFRVWMGIDGAGVLAGDAWSCPISRGDTRILPAAMPPARVTAATELRILEVRTAGGA